MRVLALVVLVFALFGVSACGSSSDDAARAGSKILQNSDSAIDDIGKSADNFGSQADNSGSQIDDVVSQQLDQFAREDVETSAIRLSEGSGMSIDESREVSCALLRSYEEEGSAEPFVSWAVGQMEVPPARRYQVEGAMEDLEEAISKAEAGDGLGALVSAVCAV